MQQLLSLFRMVGVDFRRMVVAFKDLPRYFRLRRQFFGSDSDSHNLFPRGKNSPCLGDHEDTSGCGRGAYFYQDLWVAQQIFHHAPARHIDVGSRVDGFVAHVASFRKIDVIDIRPLPDDIPNVYFKQANMMEKLPFELEECCDSVSCLHALEHFGLGRYGDPVDPTGWKKGFNNLSAMLQVGGRLYLSVPVGPSRVEFNSHRVFSVPLLISLFKDEFEIEQMALIDDEGYLHAPFDWEKAVARESSEVKNGCGVVIAIKRQLKK